MPRLRRPSLLRVAARCDRILVRFTGRSWVGWLVTRRAGVPNVPALLLRTVGARTGQSRDVPLFFARDRERFVIVGSRGGNWRDPQWVRNLRVEPRAVIWVGRRRVPVRAELLEGAERERAWRLLTGLWPEYERYAARAKPYRELPVFALKAEEPGS